MGWRTLTQALVDNCNSLGARLHRCDDGVSWIAYAQWPDFSTWKAGERTIVDILSRTDWDENLEFHTEVLAQMTVTDDLLIR